MAGSAAGLLVGAPLMGGPSATNPVARWRTEIAEASNRFGVPEDWIARVMRAESGGQTMLAGRLTISAAGAIGLMQLMPATWADMRAAYELGDDPYQPRDNILAGAAYLRLLYERFGYPGLFAAYNAGPARYAAYLSGRATLPRETSDYLARLSVTSMSKPSRQLPQVQPGLFIAQREVGNSDVEAPSTAAEAEPRDPLFAIRAPQ